MSQHIASERWPRVSKRNPCPICEHDGYCRVSPDGAIAGCMRVQFGSFKTAPTNAGDMYLHRLTDEPRELPSPPPVAPEAPQRDTIADRAVYALVVGACAPLPDFAEAELERRFGTHWRAIATAQRIGYCDGPALLAALEEAGRRRQAIAAGVLNDDGTVSRSLLGRLVIPYIRGGQVHDLRGSGIKGRGETKELSLRGGYAERGVGDLFYHDDQLGELSEDGDLHLAGGAWKTAALLEAALPAVGLRGEAELSDGHIARLVASGVKRVIAHIDAEDPKEGQLLSAGRRLGLQKAEKLAAAGLAVAIAEPPREPGTPKVDPDALLRDLGPRAVRDYALSAIPLAAWRVVIGVDAPGVPPEVAERVEQAEARVGKMTKTLSNVLYAGRNSAIKAECRTLVASILHIGAEQANGRVTPSGRIRQPLYIPAEGGGVTNKTASRHMRLGPENDLFDREVLKEVLVRNVDETTGERHNTLRLVNERGKVVEEFPAELVFGPTGEPPQRSVDGDDGGGAYYVRPHHETDVLFERLVTLAPVKTKKNGEVQESWGGKRTPCPECQSRRRLQIEVCADCGHEFKRREILVEVDPMGPDQVGPVDSSAAPLPDRQGEPESVPPTFVVTPEAEAAYPEGSVTYQRAEPTRSDTLKKAPACEDLDPDDEADDWDDHYCNEPGCTRMVVMGARYCKDHRDERKRRQEVAPVRRGASFTLGDQRVGLPRVAGPEPGPEPPPAPVEAFTWPAGIVSELVEVDGRTIERIRRAK